MFLEPVLPGFTTSLILNYSSKLFLSSLAHYQHYNIFICAAICHHTPPLPGGCTVASLVCLWSLASNACVAIRHLAPPLPNGRMVGLFIKFPVINNFTGLGTGFNES